MLSTIFPVSRYCLFILIFFSLALFHNNAFAADAGDTDEVTIFEQRLSGLQDTLKAKEKEKKELEKKLKLEADDVTKEQLQQELNAADDIIVGVREEIVKLSTGGVELYSEPPVVDEEFDWQKDLELIFEPLLDQLREISERPRLIEKLEADIDYWNKRKESLSTAIANLESNIKAVTDKTLKRQLNDLLDTANSRSNTAQQKLSLLENELTLLRQSKNPIWSTLADIFSNVVAGIIIHFFIAVAAAVLIYQIIKLLSLIPIVFINKNKPKETVFAERAIVVTRSLLGGMLAVLVYFVVLYSFAEWLLLVLSTLIIAGIVLGLKDAIPAYFIEIKTLLNMGSIRQGERIIFNDIPWRVNRLNVHTHLHNPALHGHLRVPLSEIVNVSSRPYHDDEPWFPTKVGDVVLMEDGAFGKVVRQTPDLVEINHGDSIYSYKSSDFISRRPRNFSKGFTVYEIFGFDYKHQADICDEIYNTYQKEIKEAVEQSDYEKFSTYLEVEFNNASASSLDFKILASFTGEAAEDYYKIRRFLQKVSVDIANKYGWVIPFQQVTIHHQPVE
jgi:predicted  nucleic acid-binding Zn-ribbon protein